MMRGRRACSIRLLCLSSSTSPTMRRPLDLSLRVNRQMFEPVVDKVTGTNVIVFACGMGDGTYPVWSGSTIEGEVAQVVVDLEFLSRCVGAEDRRSRS